MPQRNVRDLKKIEISIFDRRKSTISCESYDATDSLEWEHFTDKNVWQTGHTDLRGKLHDQKKCKC